MLIRCPFSLNEWFRSPNCLRTPNAPGIDDYDAIRGWRYRKKCCFTCRTVVQSIPTPQYIVKDLLATVKPHLQHAEGATETNPAAGPTTAADLADAWSKLFDKAATEDTWFWDHEDGVRRCRGCFHEIQAGECGCGMYFSDAEYSGEEDNGEESQESEGTCHSYLLLRTVLTPRRNRFRQ